ncbi:MAG: substrate-binding domain-containing protein [Sphaerochaeta sp.]|nr:substrate-binding domain-containing protein [Sphaerochaeta sp.]
MRKKLALGLLLAVFVTTMVFAAGQKEVATKEQGYRIAYMTPALHIPFWKDIADGIRDEAAKIPNITIVNSDSKLSAATQFQNAQDLIVSGIDAIIISPTDSASCPAVLELAEENKVPVIICDIGTDSGNFTAFVATDNDKGARSAGEYFLKVAKERNITSGDVAIIAISQARQNGKDRTKGFSDALAGTNFKVTTLLECKEYTRSESMNLAQDILASNPKLTGLFTQHDEANLGVMPAKDTAGVTKALIHVGFDGSPETVEAIKSGKISAAAMQQPVTMGREAFKATYAYLTGQSFDKKIVVDTILVTAENVLEVEPILEDNVYPNELSM